MPRKPTTITLNQTVKDELGHLLRKSSLVHSMALRIKIILLAAEGLSNEGIAAKLDIHRNSVSKWRARFLAEGTKGLLDHHRQGAPPKYSASDKKKVVTRVCKKPPTGRSRWTVRSLAAAVKMPASVVHLILQEYDLHPHRLRTFNFSPDPNFEDKLLDVVGLYMNAPENAVVLCMDEKTGIQALDRTQPVLPLRSKNPQSWSNEYVRHGTRTMLAAIDINTGRATTWVNKTRKTVDFIKFMNQVVEEYPDQRLCVVMDNLNTHIGKSARQWLERHPQVSFHYTPTHASWVNLAESFFSILTRQGLQNKTHKSVRELTKHLNRFVEEYNKTCGPYIWTKGPEKLKRIISLTKEFQKETHTD